MKNVRPCPYCGGEVEVVRMPDKKDKSKNYRIECMQCRRLAYGIKFEIESEYEGKERIKEYEEVLNKRLSIGSSKIQQSENAKRRDRRAIKQISSKTTSVSY